MNAKIFTKTYNNANQMLAVYLNRINNGSQKYQALLINKMREMQKQEMEKAVLREYCRFNKGEYY